MPGVEPRIAGLKEWFHPTGLGVLLFLLPRALVASIFLVFNSKYKKTKEGSKQLPAFYLFIDSKAGA